MTQMLTMSRLHMLNPRGAIGGGGARSAAGLERLEIFNVCLGLAESELAGLAPHTLPLTAQATGTTTTHA